MKTNRYHISAVVLVLGLFLLTTMAWSMDPPIAHWKLDESEGDMASDEMGAFPGALVGNSTWAPEAGKYGGAIQCEDDSSFITIDDPGGSLFDELGIEFTVSVWVAVYEFTQNWQGILFKNNLFFLERNNSSSGGTINGIHFKVKDETGAQPFNLYGNILIDDGDWHHIVGIYNVDKAYLYVDGELDVEGDASGEMIGLSDDPFVIGAKFENTYRNSWNGLIDEVKLFDYAMSPEQVDSLFSMDYTSIQQRHQPSIETFVLEDNYPNPFNPETRIEFSIPQNDVVTVEILDPLGRIVHTLVSEELSAGRHAYTWHAGAQASGLYFYRVTTSDYSQTRKMLLVK